MHGLHRDLRRPLVGKVKFSRGDAAERDALQPPRRGQVQAAAVAGGKQRFVLRRHTAFDDGADGVQDIPAGQMERRGDLGLAGRLKMTLLLQQGCAGKPKLDPGGGVDGIVDALVVWHIAAGHTGVCDGVAF